MKVFFIDILVRSGVIAAAAVGLSLHLRLVRYFDLGWAIWGMMAALVGMYVARALSSSSSLSSLVFSIVAGGIVGAVLGAITDGAILRRTLTSFIPKDVLERFNFTGALALFLVFTSAAEVLGFRDQEMVPASGEFWLGLSTSNLAALCVCWGSLISCCAVRFSSFGVRMRALLDNSSACPLWGLNVPVLASLMGGLAGALTGVSASSFGLIYRAHYSTGLEIMLIAVIPCILVALRSTVRVIAASIGVVTVIEITQFKFGYTAAEFLVYGGIILVLILRPEGLTGRQLREV